LKGLASRDAKFMYGPSPSNDVADDEDISDEASVIRKWFSAGMNFAMHSVF
jgi:hypothetical protein